MFNCLVLIYSIAAYTLLLLVLYLLISVYEQLAYKQ
jgi:hypothetical protein